MTTRYRRFRITKPDNLYFSWIAVYGSKMITGNNLKSIIQQINKYWK